MTVHLTTGGEKLNVTDVHC